MKKRRIIPTEHQEQAAVVDWFQSYARTKGIDPRLLIAVPNAQILLGLCKSDKDRLKVLTYLKAEGMQPGVPDLFLAKDKRQLIVRGRPVDVDYLLGNVPGGRTPRTEQITDKLPTTLFNGLFIEIKRKGGKPSKDQLFMAELLRSAGFNVVIAEGFEEAERAIRAYIET